MSAFQIPPDQLLTVATRAIIRLIGGERSLDMYLTYKAGQTSYREMRIRFNLSHRAIRRRVVRTERILRELGLLRRDDTVLRVAGPPPGADAMGRVDEDE